MLRRKRGKWFEAVSLAQSPIHFEEFSSQGEVPSVASFISEKIRTKELDGFLTPDSLSYVPRMYVTEKIKGKLQMNGVVDICELIDLTELSGNVLEEIILSFVQKHEGFFDLIKRKFYTKGGAIAILKQFLGKTPVHHLEYLLNQIFWSDDQLEAVLDLMAENGLFRGYIDPIKQRLYNFTFLYFDQSSVDDLSYRALNRFLETGFQLSSEVPLSNISELTGFSPEDCLNFLEKNKKHWSFLLSFNHDFLYSTVEIVTQILLDIYVYQEIPLDFWINRLDLDFNYLNDVLIVLNEELGGVLSPEELNVPSLIEGFERGLDVEKIAAKLHIEALELLKRVEHMGSLLNLRIIAGDTIDPFLVKGMKKFEIFCQIDTSSYQDPSLYFECQNCRRIMCKNCRKTDTECPFCGNIAAFIVDLPRYCVKCNITFTHSYNLETTEACYFCKTGPLKAGWKTFDEEAVMLSTTETDLVTFIGNYEGSVIDLSEIVTNIEYPSAEIIKMLEKLIINQKIQAFINIKEMQLVLSDGLKTTFICEICTKSIADSELYFCNSCKASVCIGCYQEMNSVGMTTCPGCGNTLKHKNE